MIKIAVYSLLLFLFSTIVFLFWHQELVYSLPTPVPSKYQEVKIGTTINLEGKIKSAEGRAVFIHFYNPDCACSKFNVAHFSSLIKKYGDKLMFVVVVEAKEKSYTTEQIQNKIGNKIPVLFDQSIAGLCGVYSTPQAVILDNQHHLFYRGNYNRSRYCSDAKTNYAQQALESFLGNKKQPDANPFAQTAYGCSLPGCKK